MSERARRRFARYALFSLVHLVIVALVVLTPLDGGLGGLIVLVVSVPLLWAWGLFHADLTMNESLDDRERTAWRIALWCVPWSMALYWHRHVREAP